MKITVSQRRGKAYITAFNGIKEISTQAELLEIARYDHVPVELTEGLTEKGILEKYHRSDNSFVAADTVYMDCDNEKSENPDEWMTPEKLAKRIDGIKFYWVESRNNMKQKKEKSPRPRHHYYFELSREISDVGEYRILKQKILNLIPEFDADAKQATQQAFGVETPNGGFFDGKKFIDEIIGDLNAPDAESENEKNANERRHTDGEKIYEPGRNSELYNYAVFFLSNYTTETARKNFYKTAERCEPPLKPKELESIWHSALKADTIKLSQTANDVIKTYAEPDNPDFDIEAIRDFYIARAEKITSDKQRIKNAWNKAKKKFKNSGKHTPLPKTPLTFRDIEHAMKEDGITIKTNVITKDVQVDGIPADSKYTPEQYAKLSPEKQSNVAADMIASYLKPKLKDKNFSFTGDDLNKMLSSLAQMNEYNPVAEMLDKLEWDNTDRFATLNRVLGISDNPLYCSYVKKYFIQAIAFALNTEKNPVALEFVLTLKGEQGIGKTTFFQKTALRNEWFLESAIYDAKIKDKEIEASQAWIVELGEVGATFKRNQNSELKGFLTKKYDFYRVPYDVRAHRTLRRTVFCATVNNDEFLTDTDGGSRRWAVVHIRKNILPELLNLPENFFEQVYAQAYQLYKQGETFRLTPFERKAQEAENSKYAVPKKGELEVYECLDWDADISKWNEKSALDILNGANLKGITAWHIGRVLSALIEKDSRVVRRKSTAGTHVYLLPPFRHMDGLNEYAETANENDESTEQKEQAQSDFTHETKGLYEVLMKSYKKNRVKIPFEKFVESMDTETIAKFLNRPLNGEEGKEKESVINYYHIYYKNVA